MPVFRLPRLDTINGAGQLTRARAKTGELRHVSSFYDKAKGHLPIRIAPAGSAETI